MSVVLPQLPDDLADVAKLKSFLTSLRSAMSLLQDETKDTTDSLKNTTVSSAIATADEAIAGTDDTKIITPLKLRNGLNASGEAPVYACRAWVNFNGAAVTTNMTGVAASGNVSSVVDNGVGSYTVNFTTAMEDANYSVQVCVMADGEYNNGAYSAKSATSIQVRNMPDYSRTYKDTNVSVAIFR